MLPRLNNNNQQFQQKIVRSDLTKKQKFQQAAKYTTQLNNKRLQMGRETIRMNVLANKLKRCQKYHRYAQVKQLLTQYQYHKDNSNRFEKEINQLDSLINELCNEQQYKQPIHHKERQFHRPFKYIQEEKIINVYTESQKQKLAARQISELHNIMMCKELQQKDLKRLNKKIEAMNLGNRQKETREAKFQFNECEKRIKLMEQDIKQKQYIINYEIFKISQKTRKNRKMPQQS